MLPATVAANSTEITSQTFSAPVADRPPQMKMSGSPGRKNSGRKPIFDEHDDKQHRVHGCTVLDDQAAQVLIEVQSDLKHLA